MVSRKSSDVSSRGHRGHSQLFDHGFVKPAEKVDSPPLERRRQLVSGRRIGRMLLADLAHGVEQIAGTADPLQSRTGR